MFWDPVNYTITINANMLNVVRSERTPALWTGSASEKVILSGPLCKPVIKTIEIFS